MSDAPADNSTVDDSNGWYSAIQLDEIAHAAQVIRTGGMCPDGLDEAVPVEVLYVTGRWCSGLPAEHQWNRTSHFRRAIPAETYS